MPVLHLCCDLRTHAHARVSALTRTATRSHCHALALMPCTHTTLHRYFDCLSPFSFLAFTSLRRYTQPGAPWASVTLELKPVLMAGLMSSTRNVPPAARPWAKATMKVAAQDYERNKNFFNVPDVR